MRFRLGRPKVFGGVTINQIIQTLIISDMVFLSAFGLLSPVFAIFLIGNIQGATIEVAGFAAMVWLLSRAAFQIPVAIFIDHRTGERDDFWINFVGSIGVSLIPLAYLFASLPYHIYLIQAVYGFLHALTLPSWKAIFTRHIDQHREGLEWAIYDTGTDLGMAVTAGIGGVVAVVFGFKTLFIIISLFSLAATLFTLKIYPLLGKRT